MWRCVCGNVEQNFVNRCAKCGRDRESVRPFADRIEIIALAGAIMRNETPHIDPVLSLARECLQDDMSIPDIARVLEKTNDPASVRLAHLLREVGTGPDKIIARLRAGCRIFHESESLVEIEARS